MYKALYRKYRPLTFDDVVSQAHITQTLINQIVNNKTAHAYLFTGSRGTGKTTCARIFAKAVNCMHLKNGNPCLECEICKDADKGVLSDIIEIDAASNNSVNDVRDLRDGAIYTPERCKYKIYIIDEVHMLSGEAFNALLKIMEEPPSHIKFILATTELHKVPSTILSRCQKFDFHRIMPEDIKKRLLYVAEQENITLTNEAASLIAKTADGGMRDALSLLDQCIAFSDNVTEDIVSNVAGIADRSYLFDIIDAVVNKEPAKAINVIQNLYNLSKSMQNICDELIAQFRNIMIAKSVQDSTSFLDCMPSETEAIKKYASLLTTDEIFDKLNLLQTCNERLAKVTAKRVEMEMCMIKLCNAGQAVISSNADMYAKIDALEKKVSGIASASAKSASYPTQTYQNNPPAQRTYPQQQNTPSPVEKSKPAMSEFKPVSCWAEIRETFAEICPEASGALMESSAVEAREYMLITTSSRFFMNLLRREDTAAKLGEAVQRVTGRIYIIKARCTAKDDRDPDSPLQQLLKKAQDNGIPTGAT